MPMTTGRETATYQRRDAPVPPPEPAEGPLGRGAAVGRFVVLYRVGSGGMGVVYAAYDPELDRKVALKLLRRAAADEAARQRQRLEAKSMARLSHPNVVTVYDVGEHDGHTYIAMEFVEGANLDDWLRLDPDRPWQEALALFLEAGRGLAAAHEAGLVHNDFKPGNVLITGDGRALVSDFGLAAMEAREAGDDEAPAVGGTPAYMAPERRAGAPADARSDQFSFCVALYRALYRRPPSSPGPDDGALARPAGTGVPRWLHRALARGLSTDPAARFASIADLLAAIDLARRRRRRGLAVAAALPVAALLIGYQASRMVRPSPCPLATDRLEAVWGPDQRDALRSALTAADPRLGAATFERVAAALDDYGGRWLAMRRDVCEATHVRGEQSEALLDARMVCLDARLDEIRGVTRVLADASPEDVEGAVTLVGALTHLGRCADVLTLSAIVPMPADPGVRAEIERLRAWLEEAGLRVKFGQAVDLDEVRAAMEKARVLGYAPLESKALGLEGLIHKSQPLDPRMAMVRFEEALRAAVASRDLVLQAQLYAHLVETAALEVGDPELARKWAGYAEASLRALGPGQEYTKGQLEMTFGNLAWMEGRYDDAYRFLKAAVASQEAAWGVDSIYVNRALHDLAIVAAELPEHQAEAVPLLRRVVRLIETQLGDRHPYLIPTLGNLAGLVAIEGDLHAALAAAERAVEVAEESRGEDHGALAFPLIVLGEILNALDRPADAAEPADRGVSIARRVYGEGHYLFAAALSVRGETDLLIERPAAALQRFQEAQAVRETILPAGHPELALGLAALGRAHLDLGRGAEADRLLGEAAATAPPKFPRDRLLLALSRGRACRGTGDSDLARTFYLEALAIDRPADDAMLGEAHWELAQVLSQASEAPRPASAEALRNAQAALELLRADGSPRTRRLRGEVEAWLAAHG